MQKHREPGFYWIRRDGQVSIEEWAPPYWYAAGNEQGIRDGESTEVLSGPLTPPPVEP